MALPTHPSYHLNHILHGYDFQSDLSEEDDYKSSAFLRVEAKWGGKEGYSYCFPPALYGMFYSHPKTKTLSYGIKKSGPEIQGHCITKEEEFRSNWRENFNTYLNILLKNIDKQLFGGKPKTYCQDHKSEHIGKFECEFFIERRQ
tara:strand:+ start:97 stop:531 length:435 start_codon:yes stop_codon:yes gene_type:complete